MGKNKSVGLSFWSYLGDNVPDSPSGANFYLPHLIFELHKRGYKIYALQEDRDGKLGEELIFKNFLARDRKEAYELLNFVEKDNFPELDILYVEWRWPIPGRNTLKDIKTQGYTPDLQRQNEILEYYHNKNETKIMIWDQDHKVTSDDEKKYIRANFVETSTTPRYITKKRQRIHVPFDMRKIMDYGLSERYSDVVLYVGNNYEREEMIDKYIKPLSNEYSNKVKFYGNWKKYPDEFDRISKKWPNISYNDRIAKDRFLEVYGDSICSPLLAKKSYLEYGHMTARILETLYFGSLPIGFREFNGIEFYLIPELIVDSPEDFIKKYNNLLSMSKLSKFNLYKKQIEKLEFMDVKYFVDLLERRKNV